MLTTCLCRFLVTTLFFFLEKRNQESRYCVFMIWHSARQLSTFFLSLCFDEMKQIGAFWQHIIKGNMIRLVVKQWPFDDGEFVSFAGYFWNYWNLPSSWFHWCYIDQWTSWCTCCINYKPFAFWSYCLFPVTQCGMRISFFYFFIFYLFFVSVGKLVWYKCLKQDSRIWILKIVNF